MSDIQEEVESFLRGQLQELAKLDSPMYMHNINFDEVIKPEVVMLLSDTPYHANYGKPDPMPSSLLHYLSVQKRINLVGSQGMGKTILLRYLAMVFSRAWLGGEPNYKKLIPIYADLRGWQYAQIEFVDFLRQQLLRHKAVSLANNLLEYVQAGQVVLLLDDLHQLPFRKGYVLNTNNNPSEYLRALVCHDQLWQKVLWVTTSNKLESFGDVLFSKTWSQLQIQNLETAQIEQAIKFSYNNLPNSKPLTKELKELLKTSRQDEFLYPQYLTQLLAYFYHFKKLPTNLVTMQIRFVEALFKGSKLNELKQNLAVLAFKMVENGLHNSVELNTGLHWLSDEKWLGAAQQLNLVQVNSYQISFANNYVFDYFCGWYFLFYQPWQALTEYDCYTLSRFEAAWRFWLEFDQANLRNCFSRLRNSTNLGEQLILISILGQSANPQAPKIIAQVLPNLGLEEVYETAIEILGKFKDPTTIPAMLESFVGQRRISDVATKVFLEFGDVAIQPLIKAIRFNKDASLRCFAIEILSVLRATRATSVLIDVLINDPNSEVKAQAAKAISLMPDTKAIEILSEITKTESDGNLRSRAVEALTKFSGEQALNALNRVALRDMDGLIRKKALEYVGTRLNKKLAAIEDSPAIEEYVETLLHDKDQNKRWKAIRPLLRIGGVYAIEALIQAAQNDIYSGVRAIALEALGIMREERAAETIIYKINHDSSSQVRNEAIEAAGYVGDKKALPYLIWAFHYDAGHPEIRLAVYRKDEKPYVPLTKRLTRSAIEAICLQNKLKLIDPADALKFVNKDFQLNLLIYGLEHFENEARCFLAQTLNDVEDKRPIQALIRAVYNEAKRDSYTRDPSILLALASTGQPEAIPVLAQATEVWGREAIVRLASLGIKATPSLMGLLETTAPHLRDAIAESLASFKDAEVVKELARLVRENENIGTKEGAIRALANLGRLAVPALPDLIALQQTDLTPLAREGDQIAVKRYFRNAAHGAIKCILNHEIQYDRFHSPSKEELALVVAQARNRLQAQNS